MTFELQTNTCPPCEGTWSKAEPGWIYTQAVLADPSAHERMAKGETVVVRGPHGDRQFRYERLNSTTSIE